MIDRHYKVLTALLGASIAVSVTACGAKSSPRAGTSTPSSAGTSMPSSSLPPSSPDPASSLPRYVAASVETADAPAEVHAGFGSTWVITHRGGEVDRIDPSTNKVTTKVPSPGSQLISVAIGAQHVWYLDADKQQVEGSTPGPTNSPCRRP